MQANTAELSTNPLSPLPEHWLSLGHAFIHQARSQSNAPCIADSTGLVLNYHEALLGSIALANILHEKIGLAEYVGVLLPPSVAAALVNIALTLLGKIPVNLNYTASQDSFNSYVSQCKLEHIITSNKVMQRLAYKSSATFLAVEALRKQLSLMVKARAWSEADLVPENLLGHFLPGLTQNHNHSRLDETAAILFTAGSTGDPKGVMLSHRNILSNIHAIQQQARLSEKEVVLGVVPFFHSFGFTLTLWTVLALGHSVVYHYDPRDARRISDLCEKYKATVLFCTPTIMRSYLRRGKTEQFKSIKLCILGGEKLKPQLGNDLEKELGIVPLEGYGLTETSPVVACNIPGEIILSDGRRMPGNRPGTVGMPLPGTTVRIVSLTTGETLPTDAEGMILVTGPQIMHGYLNKPEETSKVMSGDWFATGDLGFLDKDGFLSITGRLSQFSKIGGEMVPHLAVEQEILRITNAGEQSLSVTSTPDDNRGERLVVVYTNMGKSPEEVVKQLRESEHISNLWIPNVKDFIAVEELPVLSTGKLDLRKIKGIADTTNC